MAHERWSEIAASAQEADRRFAKNLQDIETSQRQLLAQLLSDNAGSAFGRAHDFASIDSAEAYRDRVPVQDYLDIAPFIERQLAGEQNVLTEAPVEFVEQTGGSTGGSKTLPFNTPGLVRFQDAFLAWMADLLRRRPGVAEGQVYFAMSPVGRSGKERVGVLPLGSQTPFAFFGSMADALIALSAVPVDVRRIGEFNDWQQQTCLHLLAAERLSFVWVWSPTYFTELVRAIWSQADHLLPALEAMLIEKSDGRSPAVTERLRTVERAISREGSDLSGLWPHLDTISCWTDASSKPFADELQGYFPEVFIQPKGLISTEAVVTIPYDEGDGGVLCPITAFFEFVDRHEQLHNAWDLQLGERYRVIVTTAHGLYRYDTRDLVEVVGFSFSAPRLRFVGRQGVAADLCGEKLTEEFVIGAIAESGVPSEIYVLLVPSDESEPHYRLYCSEGSDGAPDLAETANRLDQALAVNPQYEYARRIGQLRPIQPYFVTNLYARIKEHKISRGISIAGMKAPVLLANRDTELKQALASWAEAKS